MSEDSEKVAGMAIMSMARDIDELKAEIERLRRILEDACRWHEQFPVQRVREALGE